MRRRLLVAVGLVALCSAGAWAERLATVEVLLNERSAESSGIDQTLLHRLIRIRPGRNCTREEIDRDFVALLSTGLFDPSPDASYRTVGVGPGGLSVEFRLTPNPTVTGYRFRGATAVPAPVLIDAASRVAPLGRIYDVTAGSRLGRELAELYQRQDVEAHVDTPAIGRDGSVSATVHEHRIGRISVEWVGTPLAAQPDRLVARTGLRRLDLVRPSACAAGREALLATGLFESVTLSLSPPDQADLVELRFELRPSRMPRPGRPDDLDLVDPAALAGALRWHEELRAEAPFDLTPPLAPAGEARLAREGGSRGAVSACASALDRGDRPAALAYARSVTEAPPTPHPAAWAARVRAHSILGEADSPAEAVPTPAEPLDRFLVAFAVAEREAWLLARGLGCAPEAPASLRDVARAIATKPGSAPESSADYARAMDEATGALLALEAPEDVRGSLAERDELLVARELLRAFEERLADGPAPLPPLASVGWGSPACLRALLDWRASDPASSEASYALGLFCLGRALAATRGPDDVADGPRCHELGGPQAAAKLAVRYLAEAPTRASGPVDEQYPLHASLAALATCLASPGEEGARVLAQILGRQRPANAEALVFAAVGETGLLAHTPAGRRESGRRLAASLLEFADEGEDADTTPARLACLALLWSGAEKEAEAHARERLARPAPRTAPDAATLALIALKLGRPLEAVSALEPFATAPGADDGLRRLHGLSLLAAGDRGGAERALGIAPL